MAKNDDKIDINDSNIDMDDLTSFFNLFNSLDSILDRLSEKSFTKLPKLEQIGMLLSIVERSREPLEDLAKEISGFSGDLNKAVNNLMTGLKAGVKFPKEILRLMKGAEGITGIQAEKYTKEIIGQVSDTVLRISQMYNNLNSGLSVLSKEVKTKVTDNGEISGIIHRNINLSPDKIKRIDKSNRMPVAKGSTIFRDHLKIIEELAPGSSAPVRKYLNEVIPSGVYRMSASPTGLHHVPIERGLGGQSIHTDRVVTGLYALMNEGKVPPGFDIKGSPIAFTDAEIKRFKNMSDKEKAGLIIAGLFHDSWKTTTKANPINVGYDTNPRHDTDVFRHMPKEIFDSLNKVLGQEIMKEMKQAIEGSVGLFEGDDEKGPFKSAAERNKNRFAYGIHLADYGASINDNLITSIKETILGFTTGMTPIREARLEAFMSGEKQPITESDLNMIRSHMRQQLKDQLVEKFKSGQGYGDVGGALAMSEGNIFGYRDIVSPDEFFDHMADIFDKNDFTKDVTGLLSTDLMRMYALNPNIVKNLIGRVTKIKTLSEDEIINRLSKEDLDKYSSGTPLTQLMGNIPGMQDSGGIVNLTTEKKKKILDTMTKLESLLQSRYKDILSKTTTSASPLIIDNYIQAIDDMMGSTSTDVARADAAGKTTTKADKPIVLPEDLKAQTQTIKNLIDEQRIRFEEMNSELVEAYKQTKMQANIAENLLAKGTRGGSTQKYRDMLDEYHTLLEEYDESYKEFDIEYKDRLKSEVGDKTEEIETIKIKLEDLAGELRASGGKLVGSEEVIVDYNKLVDEDNKLRDEQIKLNNLIRHGQEQNWDAKIITQFRDEITRIKSTREEITSSMKGIKRDLGITSEKDPHLYENTEGYKLLVNSMEDLNNQRISIMDDINAGKRTIEKDPYITQMLQYFRDEREILDTYKVALREYKDSYVPSETQKIKIDKDKLDIKERRNLLKDRNALLKEDKRFFVKKAQADLTKQEALTEKTLIETSILKKEEEATTVESIRELNRLKAEQLEIQNKINKVEADLLDDLEYRADYEKYMKQTMTFKSDDKAYELADTKRDIELFKTQREKVYIDNLQTVNANRKDKGLAPIASLYDYQREFKREHLAYLIEERTKSLKRARRDLELDRVTREKDYLGMEIDSGTGKITMGQKIFDLERDVELYELSKKASQQTRNFIENKEAIESEQLDMERKYLAIKEDGVSNAQRLFDLNKDVELYELSKKASQSTREFTEKKQALESEQLDMERKYLAIKEDGVSNAQRLFDLNKEVELSKLERESAFLKETDSDGRLISDKLFTLKKEIELTKLAKEKAALGDAELQAALRDESYYKAIETANKVMSRDENYYKQIDILRVKELEQKVLLNSIEAEMIKNTEGYTTKMKTIRQAEIDRKSSPENLLLERNRMLIESRESSDTLAFMETDTYKRLKAANWLKELKTAEADLALKLSPEGLELAMKKLIDELTLLGDVSHRANVIEGRKQKASEYITPEAQAARFNKVLAQSLGGGMGGGFGGGSGSIYHSSRYMGPGGGGNLGWLMTNMGRGFFGSILGVSSVVGALKKSYDAIRQNELALINLRRVMGVTNDEFKHTAAGMFDMAIKYGDEIASVGKVYEEWAKTGKETKSEISGLVDVTELALNTSNIENSTDAVKYLNSSIQQMGLSWWESETLLDSWNKTADKFPADVKDFAEAYSRSASYAKNIGMDIHDLNSVISLLIERTGRGGDEIGTALRMLFSNVYRAKTQKILEEFGMTLYEIGEHGETITSKYKGFNDIMTDVSKKYRELMDANRTADATRLAEALGEARRRNFAIALMNSWENFDKVRSVSLDSEGYSMEKNKLTMESLTKQAHQLGAALQQLAVEFGKSGFTDLLKGALVTSRENIQGFNKLDPLIKQTTFSVITFLLAFKGIDKIAFAVNKNLEQPFGRLGELLLKNTKLANNYNSMLTKLFDDWKMDPLFKDSGMTDLQKLNTVRNALSAAGIDQERGVPLPTRFQDIIDSEALISQKKLSESTRRTKEEIDGLARAMSDAGKITDISTGSFNTNAEALDWLDIMGVNVSDTTRDMTDTTTDLVEKVIEENIARGASKITIEADSLAKIMNSLQTSINARTHELMATRLNLVALAMKALTLVIGVTIFVWARYRKIQQERIARDEEALRTIKDTIKENRNLVSEYEKLEKRKVALIKSGGDLNKVEEDMVTLQKRMAEVIPAATDSFTEQGDAIVTNIENFKELNEQEQEYMRNMASRLEARYLVEGDKLKAEMEDAEESYHTWSGILSEISRIPEEELKNRFFVDPDKSSDIIYGFDEYYKLALKKEDEFEKKFKKKRDEYNRLLEGHKLFKSLDIEIEVEDEELQGIVENLQRVSDEFAIIKTEIEEFDDLDRMQSAVSRVSKAIGDSTINAVRATVSGNNKITTTIESNLAFLKTKGYEFADIENMTSDEILETLDKYIDKKWDQVEQTYLANLETFRLEKQAALDRIALLEIELGLKKELLRPVSILDPGYYTAIKNLEKSGNLTEEATKKLKENFSMINVSSLDTKFNKMDPGVLAQYRMLESTGTDHYETAIEKTKKLIQEIEESMGEIYDKMGEGRPDSLIDDRGETADRYKQLTERLKLYSDILEDLRYEMELLDTQYKKSPENIDYLTKKNELLGRTIIENKNFVKGLNIELSKLATKEDVDKIEELKKKIRELTVEIISFEVQKSDVDRVIFTKGLEDIQHTIDLIDFHYDTGIVDQNILTEDSFEALTLGITKYSDTMAALNAEQLILETESKRLGSVISNLTAELALATDIDKPWIQSEIDYLNNLLKETSKELRDVRLRSMETSRYLEELFSKALTAGYNKALKDQIKVLDDLIKKENERHDKRIKHLNEELEAKEKLWAEEDYSDKLKEIDDEIEKLEKEYNRYAVDNSQWAAKKRKEIEEQLVEARKRKRDEESQHDRETYREGIQDKIKAEDEAHEATIERHEDEKEATQDKYDKLLEYAETYSKKLAQEYENSQLDIISFLESKIPEYESIAKEIAQAFAEAGQEIAEFLSLPKSPFKLNQSDIDKILGAGGKVYLRKDLDIIRVTPKEAYSKIEEGYDPYMLGNEKFGLSKEALISALYHIAGGDQAKQESSSNIKLPDKISTVYMLSPEGKTSGVNPKVVQDRLDKGYTIDKDRNIYTVEEIMAYLANVPKLELGGRLLKDGLLYGHAGEVVFPEKYVSVMDLLADHIRFPSPYKLDIGSQTTPKEVGIEEVIHIDNAHFYDKVDYDVLEKQAGTRLKRQLYKQGIM